MAVAVCALHSAAAGIDNMFILIGTASIMGAGMDTSVSIVIAGSSGGRWLRMLGVASVTPVCCLASTLSIWDIGVEWENCNRGENPIYLKRERDGKGTLPSAGILS